MVINLVESVILCELRGCVCRISIFGGQEREIWSSNNYNMIYVFTYIFTIFHVPFVPTCHSELYSERDFQLVVASLTS